MPTFTGTNNASDTITPGYISPGVTVSPSFTYPGAAADTIFGYGGNDLLDAAGGNDSIDGGQGSDTIIGGDGNDTLLGGTGADDVSGGAGDDYIRSNLGSYAWVHDPLLGKYVYEYDDDTISGGSGTDTLDLSTAFNNQNINLQTGTSWFGEVTGIENLIGTAYGDYLYGSDLSNMIDGGGGNDWITGGVLADSDTLTGGAGDDTIDGGAGTDRISGGDGNDYLYGGAGAETISGGAGVDTFNNTRVAISYALNLSTGVTNVAGETVTQCENAVLGAGNDTVTGTGAANLTDLGAGNDAAAGGGGNDSVFGGTGSDTLQGAAGSDRLAGGLDADVLVGGLGRDTFVFVDGGQYAPTGQDRIIAGDGAIAFEGAGSATGDRIDLSAVDADNSTAVDDAFIWGSTGRGHLSVIASGSNSLVRGNIDSDADFEIAILIEDGGILASLYTTADFLL